MVRLALALLTLILAVSNASAYWQQRVKYDIDVTLIDSIHSLDGKLSVQYTNNSPDTLREVYFHLYYLAFQPGSMMQVRSSELSSADWSVGARILRLKESEQGKYRIDPIAVDGAQAKHEITGTVMKVTLPRPLLPNTTTTIAFTYFEQIPKQTRRGGWMSGEGVQYSMAQWYPKIAEYDEHGWHASEYISREFYGVWGDFDVSITLPSSFTVAASGQVMNPREVGKGYDRIAAGEKSGQAMPEEKSGMTTWNWRAENVHDFAWVADKTYIHDWATIRDSVTIHAIYKTSVMSMWKNTLKYTEFMINTMSDLYYPYPYRNFYNTHAGDGGMEYPMLVQNTGYRSEMSMAGITAHEGAHQWFYGILANNEIREAYLDEGFTSYATTQIMVKQFGNEQQGPGVTRTWLDWFIPKPNNKGDNYRSYLNLAKSGYEEPLDIPHDWAREDVNAGQAYGKMQAIVSMLEYTLGESTFNRAMKEYFNRWKFKHPSLDDFQRVMEDVSGAELDWFFDQWFRTERTVDYAIVDYDSDEEGSGYKTSVKILNLDDAVMPLDLHLTYKDGTTDQATIPLGLNRGSGYKKQESKLFFPAWDWVAREYESSIITPKEVETIEIDTSWRLQDLNRLNNRFGTSWVYGFIPVKSPDPHDYLAVWKQLNINPPLDGVYWIFRPIAMPILPFLNPLGDGAGFIGGVGVKMGAYGSGGEGDFKLWVRHSDNILDPKRETVPEMRGRASVPLTISKSLVFDEYLGLLNGLFSSRFTFERTVRPTYLTLGPTHKLRAYFEAHSVLPELRSYVKPVHPYDLVTHRTEMPWQEANTRVAGLGYHFTSEQRSFDLDLYGETSIWGSSRSYLKSRITMSQSVGLFWGLRSMLRLNAGMSRGDLPYERMFSTHYADIATHQLSDTYQAYRWWSKDRAKLRGGAGLIGTANLRDFDNHVFEKTGTQMLGFNIEITGLQVPYIPQLGIGLHAGAGWVGDRKQNATEIWKNAQVLGGVSLNLDLRSLFPWQLQGVVDQYAPTPGFTLAGKQIYSGSSF